MPHDVVAPGSTLHARDAALRSRRVLLVLTMGATVAADLTLTAIARSRHPAALAFHAVTHPIALRIATLVVLGATIAATAALPLRRPSWIYGAGMAWGGGTLVGLARSARS